MFKRCHVKTLLSFKVIIDSDNISQSFPISFTIPLDLEAWKRNNLGH